MDIVKELSRKLLQVDTTISAQIKNLKRDLDILWLLIGAFLVFFMQVFKKCQKQLSCGPLHCLDKDRNRELPLVRCCFSVLAIIYLILFFLLCENKYTLIRLDLPLSKPEVFAPRTPGTSF